MNEECIACDPQRYAAAESVFLRIFGFDGNVRGCPAATSLPLPRLAAADILRLFEQAFAVRPDVDALKRVVRMPGATAWGSATASDAHAAARQVCLRQDLRAARGTLVIITLSSDSSIVASIKAALTAIYHRTPAAEARAFAVAHDKTLRGQIRVELLLTGL